MLQPLIPFVVCVFILNVSAVYILPTLPDLLREERISSFMAQKPLPTSALLAGAAMSSYPSPLPVGSHPLEATTKGRVEALEDDVDALMNEMDELKEEIERLKGKAVKAGLTNDGGKENWSNAGQIVMNSKEKSEADTYDEGSPRLELR